MRRPAILSLCLLLLLLPLACSETPVPDESAAEAPVAPEPAATDGEPVPGVVPNAAPEPEPATDPLLDPESPDANRRAPDTYRVRFRTSQGDFVVEVTRAWAPLGADRFFNLVNAGFFNDTRFFRVVEGWVVQFGLNDNPEVNAAWSWAALADEPVEAMNTRGRLTFATGGPNTRTTQVFINLSDNLRLDGMGFSPFGEVVQGMDVVQSLYSGYGDSGPNQGRIEDEGNAYIDAEFPEIDSILQARVEGS
jgi:peptidyl-prolyl cis-trans isomerase A (cyclophilin A)